MPVTYSIDPEERLIRIVGSGRLTDDEIVACVEALRSDPKLEPDMNTLSDMCDIEVAFSPHGLAAMIEVMERTAHRRSSARAAIVVSTSTAFGMGRMLELMTGGRFDPHFRVFRDLDAARAWLQIC